MKKLLGVLAVGVLVGAAEPGEDPGKKELEKLQGTWRYASLEQDGKKTPEGELKKLVVTFTADKWAVRDGDTLVVEGTQKLDPTKEPHQIDSFVKQEDGKSNTVLGIYEIDGDTFRACFDPQGKARPRSFTPGPGQFAFVMRREKK
jgi:uncharacterized protein (TIGR03067 family)